MTATIILKGKAGLPGNVPAHQWSGNQVRFQNSDGTWGVYVDLSGPPPTTLTGNYTLTALDAGATFVSNSASAIVITVPNSLAAGFGITLIRANTGAFSVAAATGATNRSAKTLVTAQYGQGQLRVFRNTGGAAAEFIFRGDVS